MDPSEDTGRSWPARTNKNNTTWDTKVTLENTYSLNLAGRHLSPGRSEIDGSKTGLLWKTSEAMARSSSRVGGCNSVCRGEKYVPSTEIPVMYQR